jgi:hypothetical protein
MMAKKDEELQTLPPHDREQGYVSPEPVKGLDDGESDEEFEKRHAAWEEEQKAVAEREDQVVKERAKAQEEESAKAQKSEGEKTKSGSSSAGSSS